MFRRLLIANRGEIARRVIRTCRELGVETVATYSDVDAIEPHVSEADRAERLGPDPPRESYLSVGQVIDAARRSDAEAIHPGYGFLSENAAFADACRDAGFAFVGPSAEVIARAGSKIAVRELAASKGVPVVPGGTPEDQTDTGLRRAVENVGFPALLKASAGGGGKGMRAVLDATEVDRCIREARREAVGAFGDGTIYVERRLEHPRHVEVQVVGDRRGGLIHLFERECSVQRRYQKIIEESPSTALSATVRANLLSAATTVATAAGYDNVGTVEFLVEGHGDDARFYFLEMNTRLQVEHGVTELCTGVDLVQAQLEIAAGRSVPWTQDAVTTRGHAIECRLYAEDPTQDFLPQAGTIRLYREPSGPGLRIDSGVREGSTVSVHYDPLIAKLMAHAESRDRARRRAIEGLRRYAVLGLATNLVLLQRVLEDPSFVDGQFDTGLVTNLLSDPGPGLDTKTQDSLDDPLLAALAAAAAHHLEGDGAPGGGAPRTLETAWTTLSDWRLGSRHTRTHDPTSSEKAAT